MALPGVGLAAPRPPGGFAPLCAVRHTAPPKLKPKTGGRSALEELTERARTRERVLNFSGEGVGQGGIPAGLKLAPVASMPETAKLSDINLIDKLTF